MNHTRAVHVHAHQGWLQPIMYNLTWVGNDGTFSSAGSIALPANKPVTLDVTINATTVGMHSAILNLDDPATTGIDYQTMNTVIAAHQFTEGNGYSVTESGTIGRNHALHFFYFVPEGAPAFKVDLSGPSAAPGTGQVRFLRFHPYGLPIDMTSSLQCYMPPVTDPGGGCSTGDPLAAASRIRSPASGRSWLKRGAPPMSPTRRSL